MAKVGENVGNVGSTTTKNTPTGSNIYDKNTGKYVNSVTNPTLYNIVREQTLKDAGGQKTTINAGISGSADKIIAQGYTPTSQVKLNYTVKDPDDDGKDDGLGVGKTNVSTEAVNNYNDNYVKAVQDSLSGKNKILDDYLNRYISLMRTFGNRSQRQIENRLKGGLSGSMLTDQLNNKLNTQNSIASAVSQANSDKIANVDNAISKVENLYNSARDDETLNRLSNFYKNLGRN